MAPAVPASILKREILNEISLYQEYLDCVSRERGVLSKFQAESLEQLTERREHLYGLMKDADLKRRELVKELSGSHKTKLSDAISKVYHGSDARELKSLALKLRKLVHETRTSGFEFKQITNFALGMVNGLLSIFMSATQNVTRSYSKKGTLKESYNPQGPRHTTVIKEA